jgi:hypothetical protein
MRAFSNTVRRPDGSYQVSLVVIDELLPASRPHTFGPYGQARARKISCMLTSLLDGKPIVDGREIERALQVAEARPAYDFDAWGRVVAVY